MITDGRYYKTLTGVELGNDKYSAALKIKIEEAGKLCLENLHNEVFAPIMMMGNIQSGKTRAFIGLMALCFDNDFDMTIILTKCSTALVKQTVSRMTSEFDGFKQGNATVGDVVAQDILDIDFSGCTTMEQKEAVVRNFLKRYKGKKRIVVVKKQADNVDRMNMFIEELVKREQYKRLLIVDDEADITSVGYQKDKGQEELSLRRISGAINTMRKSLHSNIEHVLMQVTATPYALYLQPENFSNENIMPIKPSRTVVLPTGNGYIGGQYYFIDAEDELAENYHKAKHLPHMVSQDEMDILNGSRKNSGKNTVIKDKRTVRMEDFLTPVSGKVNFALPELRNWIFDILVGTAIVQLNPGNEDHYLSAVLHAATTKNLHKQESELIERAFEVMVDALEEDVRNPDFMKYVSQSYEGMKESVEAYGILKVPSLECVTKRIADKDEDDELVGLIHEVDIKEVNSDSDITRLLNITSGELKLENSLTIFVGGQVLDRGITIPNMISFFYGRDPKTMQQDTVMQHCRMFGYRKPEQLSVTRFYTTYRLYSSMKEITIRDNLLRERMLRQNSGEVVYLEAGGKIKACSPQKILASKVHSIIPEKRYLPVGFDIIKKGAESVWKSIDKIIKENKGYLTKEFCSYNKGDSLEERYVKISSETAMDLLEKAYSILEPKDDGVCNIYEEMESVFLFSLSERMKMGDNDIALIVRTDRQLSKMKRNGTMYQDSPDDGKNEGAIAKKLRENIPVLVLTEQCNPEWGKKFWWPVYYTPCTMNVGLYADESEKSGVVENIHSAGIVPIYIEDFSIVNNIGVDEIIVSRLKEAATEVRDFYTTTFERASDITSTRNRKARTCNVYIDWPESFSTMSDMQARINGIIDNVEKIFLKHGDQFTDSCNQIIKYLMGLMDGVPADEDREQILQMIDELHLGKNQKSRLRQLIYEADDIAKLAIETLGYFMPMGSGHCEIRLNYYAIKDICQERGKAGTDVLPMLAYILAHEMYHALHYADVMTESGRWLYKNKDYHKQCIVKETLAEYFALTYTKNKLAQFKSELDVELFIRETRDPDNFLNDGGYSGCMIMERYDKENGNGAENELYRDMYKAALTDMPKAYEKICSVK